MRKIFFVFMFVLALCTPAFAADLINVSVFDIFKNYITLENVLATIGVVSVAMTGVPVPRAGTKLARVYSVLKYLSGNFGFADHTKKK